MTSVVKKFEDDKFTLFNVLIVLQCENGCGSLSTQCITSLSIYFRQPCRVEDTHLISLIHGHPKTILYCTISPSMICNNVCTILFPTKIGKVVTSNVQHNSSLNVLIYIEGPTMNDKGRFNLLYACSDIISIIEPSSIKILLQLSSSIKLTNKIASFHKFDFSLLVNCVNKPLWLTHVDFNI